MSNINLSKLTLVVSAALVSGSAWAQSSVTLYGVVDDAVAYQNNSTSLGSTKGGKSNLALMSGASSGSRASVSMRS
jgi:predicted porin